MYRAGVGERGPGAEGDEPSSTDEQGRCLVQAGTAALDADEKEAAVERRTGVISSESSSFEYRLAWLERSG